MGLIVNKAQLQNVFGVSHQTISEWQEQGLPILHRGDRGEANQYDVPAVIHWCIARELKKVRALSPRDEGLMLDNELKRRLLAEKDRLLVPVDQVEPVWRGRVLSAAVFLSGQHSRLAGILEATPGVEEKRRVLRAEFAQFLNRLAVDGERMQEALDELFDEIGPEKTSSFMQRIWY